MAYKIASFFASDETINKYFPVDVFINDLYTDPDIILKHNMVAIHKEDNGYSVYASKNDPDIWIRYKLRIQSYYFNN